jgi:hypothetical protein
MAGIESPGFAMKNFSIGMEEPAAGPLLQVVPLELWHSAGTKTLY